MQNLETLSDQALLYSARDIAQKEKSYSLTLLEHLLEIDNRKLYATLGYDSLFKYVVRELGYSESVAYERIRAMRLVRRVPQAKNLLQSGALNLTNAAKLESFSRQESSPPEVAEKLVEDCAGKTGSEVEKHLLSKAKNPIPKDRTRNLTAELKEARLVLTPELQTLILRFEELHGKQPLSQILQKLLSAHLQKKDPLVIKPVKKAETAKHSVKEEPPKEQAEKENLALRSRAIPAQTKRQVWLRSQGQCEWKDNATGLRCTSRYRLQFDHFPVPFALGGSHSASNLRHACPAHNARFAVEVFGTKRGDLNRQEGREAGCHAP